MFPDVHLDRSGLDLVQENRRGFLGQLSLRVPNSSVVVKAYPVSMRGTCNSPVVILQQSLQGQPAFESCDILSHL